MSHRKGPAWARFIRLFGETAPHRHRYEVFRDFVTMAAISLHNALSKNEKLEAEYLATIGRYERADVDRFPKLLGELIEILDIEPWDALGQMYMELEIHSEKMGQFFTPPALSELMARITASELMAKLDQPFLTVCEPACGAGGMILAFTKVLIEHGHNPVEKLWVQCQDIDRMAALMCYLQLSLWHVPGVVIVGNTLAVEAREVFYTPAHHLGCWSSRLAIRRAEEAMLAPMGGDADHGHRPEADVLVPSGAEGIGTATTSASKKLPGAFGTQSAFDFDL
jgi:hypothetical protein